jgi:hypothetical protein
VLDEQIHVFLEFKDGEHLFEGHIDGVGLRLSFDSAGAHIAFIPAARISSDGGFGVLDHVVMETLPLPLLPMLHLNFIIIEIDKQEKKQVKPWSLTLLSLIYLLNFTPYCQVQIDALPELYALDLL